MKEIYLGFHNKNRIVLQRRISLGNKEEMMAESSKLKHKKEDVNYWANSLAVQLGTLTSSLSSVYLNVWMAKAAGHQLAFDIVNHAQGWISISLRVMQFIVRVIIDWILNGRNNLMEGFIWKTK